MNRTGKPVCRMLLIVLALVLVTPVLAVVAGPPALPASLYGTLRLSGGNAPDGASLFVYAGALEVGHTQTYLDPEYGTVYSLNIRADDPDTALIEGGKTGDILTFVLQLPDLRRIEGSQTAIWSSGSNVERNLNFSDGSFVHLPLIMAGHHQP